MRDFLIILHNFGRFFLLFEKSVSQGHHQEVMNELKENKKELQKLRQQCIVKITNQQKDSK